MSRRAVMQIPLALAVACSSATVLSPSAFAQGSGKFDSTAFKAESAEAGDAKSEAAKAKSQKATAAVLETREGASLGAEAIQVRLEAFNTLIKSEQDPDQKAKILVARAGLFLQKAREARASLGKGEGLAEVVKDLERAQVDAEKIAKDTKRPVSVRSLAYYIAGAALADMEQNKASIDRLKKALETDPQMPFAGAITLYLAEDAFEREKYKESAELYEKYLKSPTPKYAVLARYKIGWSHVYRNDLSAAETQFVELIKLAHDDDLGRESIRDLASVSAQRRTEQGTIDFSKEMFGNDPKARVEFLSSAFVNYQRGLGQRAAGQKKSDAKAGAKKGDDEQGAQLIFAELLKLAQDPVKRVQLWLEAIRNARRSHATRLHMAAFTSMRDDFASLPEDKIQNALGSLGADVEGEMQALVWSFAETYAGRVENRDQIAKLEMAQNLQEIFRFYERYFPKASNRQAMYRLWMDVCADQKDSACVYKVSKKIQGDGELKTLHEDASVEQLAALERLSKEDDGGQYRQELMATLEKMSQKKDFRRWADVAGRLSGLYSAAGEHDKAVKLLHEVQTRSPSEAAFYRLQAARFQAGKFDEILSAQDAYKTERLRSLTREASLKIAIRAQEKGDLAAYEAGIEKYLASGPEAQKELLVLHDHLQYLREKAGLDKAAARLALIPPAKRASASLRDATVKIAIELMQKADFRTAESVLKIPAGTPGRKELLYESVLARLGNGTKVDAADIDGLEEARREYVLGLLSFSQSEKVLLYVKTMKKPTQAVRRIAYLAAQIDQGKIEPVLEKDLRRIVGDVAPRMERPPTRTEIMAQQVRFPSPSLDAVTYANRLKTVLVSVRKIRNQVPSDVKGQPPELQLRVIRAAIAAESQAAEAVKRSPVPDGLAKPKRDAYKAGLEQIASEFSAQADDYRRAERAYQVAVNEGRGARRPASEVVKMPVPKLDPWPWPQNASRPKVFSLVREKRTTSSLIMLDLQRDANALAAGDYWIFRSGVLLAASRSPAMIDYVYRELRDAGQNDLIERWKRQ